MSFRTAGTETHSKPRLKPSPCGALNVVKVGKLPWVASEAKAFVTTHYGTLKNFATKFGLRYWAVVVALAHDVSPQSCAGDVSICRQILGLPSKPSRKALTACAAFERKRSATHQPARASERPDRQNASADCVGGTHTGRRA